MGVGATATAERAGKVLALAACSLAAIALWTWGAGVADLLTPQRLEPTPPMTAMMALATGISMLLLSQARPGAIVRRAGLGMGLLVVAYGVFASFRPTLGWASPLESWLVHRISQSNPLPVEAMCPVGGTILALASGGLLLRQCASLTPLRMGTALAILGAIGGAIAFFPGAGGRCWLPGLHCCAMSPLTAAMLTALACAACVARPGGLDAPTRTPASIPMVATLVLALVTGLAGAIYLYRQQRERRADARLVLEAIGDLKAAQIAAWRNERSSDARFFASAAFVADDVRNFLLHPTDAQAREKLVGWLTQLKAGDRYACVSFLDTNQQCRVSVPDRPATPPSIAPDYLAALDQVGHAVMTDIHRGATPGELHIDLAFRVPDRSSPVPIRPLGTILLRIDPRQHLFPSLRAWPTPSRTAEAVLVRRDGNEAVYLNDIRGHPDAALNLRLPIDPRHPRPATEAALGHAGFHEGDDHRGVPVLAVVRPIEGSPWFLVAKIDRAEVYGPLRSEAWLVLAATILLAAASGLAVWLLWHRRRQRETAAELAAEQERLALVERIEVLMRNASDIILIIDEQNRILEANDRAIESYGRPLSELRKLRIPDLLPPGSDDILAGQIAEIRLHGHARFESVNRRADGSFFPVEVSVRRVVVGGDELLMAIVRDIAERKRHEREIERLSRLYATLSQINQCIVRAASREELFAEVCRIVVAFGGFKLAWFGRPDPNSGEVHPLTSAGDTAYLDGLHVRADLQPEGLGPAGTCLRENRTCIVNDFAENPRTAPWHTAARAYGMHAVGVFPVRFGGSVFGVLAVYSGERDVFLEREVALLEEAAMDLSFALDHRDQADRRRRAEDKLQRSLDELRARNQELERFNRASVGRELRMIELKRTIDDLRRRMGEHPPRSAGQDAAGTGPAP